MGFGRDRLGAMDCSPNRHNALTSSACGAVAKICSFDRPDDVRGANHKLVSDAFRNRSGVWKYLAGQPNLSWGTLTMIKKALHFRFHSTPQADRMGARRGRGLLTSLCKRRLAGGNGSR